MTERQHKSEIRSSKFERGPGLAQAFGALDFGFVSDFEFRDLDFRPPVRAGYRGSALILTVVLTSLLAIVGVLFVLAARIDRMASSATTETRELNLALETVLAVVGETLAADVPGVGTHPAYYVYPDANNPWLASAEPYQSASGGPYFWRQISNVAGLPAASVKDVRISLVGEREPIRLNDPNTNADTEGDGKGQPIYAAVRILDNSGMLNVNTGYKFDPGEKDGTQVDGHSQLQVNLLALANGPGHPVTMTDEAALLGARANHTANAAALNLIAYEQQIIWQYPDRMAAASTDPNSPFAYTPFDLSDELELRYRFLLNQTAVDTRLENWGQFRQAALRTPVDTSNQLGAWFRRVAGGGLDPNYAYRTIATTYNVDRILTPKPFTTDTGTKLRKMVNVNTADQLTIRAAVAAALAEADPNTLGIAEKAIQITANLMDYIDDDDEITVVSGLSSPYYGFERPCLYLSEVAYRQVKDPDTGELHTSYAIELYRPYFEDKDPRPGDWKIVIDNPAASDFEMDIAWSGSRRFHVLLAEDAAAPLTKDYVLFADPQEPSDTMPLYGYNRSAYQRVPQGLGKATFEAGATISLQRRVASAGKWIIVDSKRVPEAWITADGVARSLQRDIAPNKCIRRLWASEAQTSTPGLGNAAGNYVDAQRPEVVQAHPADKPLTNIGELGMILARSAYGVPEGALAADCLVDLRNPIYRKLFNYLTVMDPAQHPGLAADETRIMGRININTAPAFVLAQLPWMQYEDTSPFEKANAIVAYRDSHGPYRSIADLMQVDPLCALAFDEKDNQHDDAPRGPDLTPDTARDDMEERDLLFTRISNLVTVRSDVFTAYIVARIGTNGPQRRIIAILDRSKANSAGDKVRIVARYPVPDPR
jgi:DNA uptake protein ComE-like DNA-binding protein